MAKKITQMSITEMTTIEQLTEASEYEKFDLQALIVRAAEVAETEAEYNEFVKLCRSYEKTLNAGSWSKAPATIK